MIVANGKALCVAAKVKKQEEGAKYSCDGSNPSGHTDFKLKISGGYYERNYYT